MKRLLTILGMVLVAFGMYARETPEFPGGDAALSKYLKENVHYPEIAKENGVEGIVLVGFIVNTDGSLKDVKVLKYIDPDLEKEAIRVVDGMPAWLPAEKDGTPIEAPSEVDVPFILD